MEESSRSEVLSQIREKNLLSPRKLQVYEIIFHDGPVTATQIRIKLENHGIYTTSRVRTIINELMKQKCVRMTKMGECPVTKSQVFFFETTASLPLKYVQPKTKMQIIRQRMMDAEKALANVRAFIPLTKDGKHLEGLISKYFETYPNLYEYMKVNQRGNDDQLGKGTVR